MTATHNDLNRLISTTLMPGFVGLTLPAWLATRLRDGLGGVCLFGDNIHDAEQIRQLTSDIRRANPAAIIAIDEEGGDVTRLHYRSGSPFPGNAILGRIDDEATTESVARTVGQELKAAGINLALAPDVDINSNPLNPVIGVRSFGADTELVAAHSAAWTRGVQSTGVAACAKHFPGHGDTDQDSHLALPVINRSREELLARELRPFMAVINAGTRTIMTSHIMLPHIDPEHPATMSPLILDGVLRTELGFEGVIVSDALDMHGASGVLGIPEAAARSLAAGVDLLCLGSRGSDEQMDEIFEHITEAVREGRLDAQRIADAATRVLALSRDLREPLGDAREPFAPEASGVPGFADVAKSFDGLEQTRQGFADFGTPTCVVRIDSVANIAVGDAPWGPFAAGSVAAGIDSWARIPVVPVDATVDSGDYRNSAIRAILSTAAGGPIVVVGKNNHVGENVRDFIDSLREASHRVVVVDMGWPGEDRHYADIATYGASRLAGRALISTLAAGAES